MHDAQHFRLSPTEALMLDPQTRLLLEVSVTAQGRYKVMLLQDCSMCASIYVQVRGCRAADAVVCLSNLVPDQRKGAMNLSNT